jgi:hypothetical protein
MTTNRLGPNSSPNASVDEFRNMETTFNAARTKLKVMQIDIEYFKLIWANSIKWQLERSGISNESIELIVNYINEYDNVRKKLGTEPTDLEESIDEHIKEINKVVDDAESESRRFANRDKIAERGAEESLRNTTQQLRGILVKAITEFEIKYVEGTNERETFDKAMSEKNKDKKYKWIFDPESRNNVAWEKERLTEYINYLFERLFQPLGTHPLVQSLNNNLPKENFSLEGLGLISPKEIVFKTPKSPIAKKSSTDELAEYTNQQAKSFETIDTKTRELNREIASYLKLSKEQDSLSDLVLTSPYTIYQSQIELPALVFKNQLVNLQIQATDIMTKINSADYLDKPTNNNMNAAVKKLGKSINEKTTELENIINTIDKENLSGKSLADAFLAMATLDGVVNNKIIDQLQTSLNDIQIQLAERKELLSTIFDNLEMAYMKRLPDSAKQKEITAIFSEARKSGETDLEKLNNVLEVLTQRSKSPDKENVRPKTPGLFTPNNSFKKTTYELFRILDGSGIDKPNLNTIKKRLEDFAVRSVLLKDIQNFAGIATPENEAKLTMGKIK